MATAQAVSGPAQKAAGTTQQAGAAMPKAAEAASSQALVPAPHSHEEDEESAFSGPVARLPVELDVSVPVREFRVRHLLALVPGQLIESQWGYGGDLPLAAGAVRLAWSEFEVVETQLGVRITRLA
jgi:flagellar motor switch/type III secretory pathway protein FliN